MSKYYKFFIYSLFLIFHSSLVFSQNPWLWGKYGKAQNAYGNSVTIDHKGNCFLTGYFNPTNGPNRDTLFFGKDTLRNNVVNSLDAFIAKYDKDGNIQWARQTTSKDMNSGANGFFSSTDNMGNAYLTATFSDTMKVGTFTLSTPQYNTVSYLVKFDPNGNIVWAKQSNVPKGPTSSGTASNYVCTDKNGNSYITGIFGDTAIFDKDTLRSNAGGNAFLVKYDTKGNVKWAKATIGYSWASGGQGEGDALDGYGNVYVTGAFVDTVYFGAHTLSCPYNDYNFFLAKYDSNGNVKWAKQAKIPSAVSYGLGYAVTCDQRGNIYVAGDFIDTLVFDKDTLISKQNAFAKQTNFFVVKYDSAGNFKWVLQDNTTGSYGTSAWGISSDTMGHIYVAGNVGALGICKVSIGKDTTMTINDTTVSDAPAILLKLDTAGNLLCANMFPYAGSYYNSIASDPTGNYVYYGGSLLTEAVFGQDIIDVFNPNLNVFPIIARWKECDATLGENEVKGESEKVKVYPNPSSGLFTIALSDPISPEAGFQTKVEVYNVLGQQVYSAALKQAQGDNNINIANQPQGIYLYRVISESGNLIGEGKVVIEK